VFRCGCSFLENVFEFGDEECIREQILLGLREIVPDVEFVRFDRLVAFWGGILADDVRIAMEGEFEEFTVDLHLALQDLDLRLQYAAFLHQSLEEVSAQMKRFWSFSRDVVARYAKILRLFGFDSVVVRALSNPVGLLNVSSRFACHERSRENRIVASTRLILHCMDDTLVRAIGSRWAQRLDQTERSSLIIWGTVRGYPGPLTLKFVGDHLYKIIVTNHFL
jgi:hypothetical protein